jgi:hypothetical protein
MWDQDLLICGRIVAAAYDQPQCMRKVLMRGLLLENVPANRPDCPILILITRSTEMGIDKEPQGVSTAYRGAVALEQLSEEFRQTARECLELSQKAESLESRGFWVAMAQFWFNLAVHAEDREAIERVAPSRIGAAYDKGRGKLN